jgi:hypothetical protein
MIGLRSFPGNLNQRWRLLLLASGETPRLAEVMPQALSSGRRNHGAAV